MVSGIKAQHCQCTCCVFFLNKAPASPPSNVVANELSSLTIVITWDIVPPIDQNGLITKYQVFYEPMHEEAELEAVTVTAQTASFRLQEAMNYSIAVQAYTSVGVGPSSKKFTIKVHNGMGENLFERTLKYYLFFRSTFVWNY